MRALGSDVIMDGEAVVLNKAGVPDFDALQLVNGHEVPVIYYAFDLVWIDGGVEKILRFYKTAIKLWNENKRARLLNNRARTFCF